MAAHFPLCWLTNARYIVESAEYINFARELKKKTVLNENVLQCAYNAKIVKIEIYACDFLKRVYTQQQQQDESPE